MRAMVVYESLWGNTEQVARAVAEGLVAGWGDSADVHVGEVSELTPVAAEHMDLLVVGGPTHAFSMSRGSTRADAAGKGATQGSADTGMREWLDRLGAGDVPVATFDTRVEKVRRLPGSAAKAAARVVRRGGHPLAVRPESFYVLDLGGPLVDGELDRARHWGERLARAVAVTA